MVFRKDAASKVRARADEDKAQVRQSFITAGRRLLAGGDPAKVSLRRIAAEAGYSPGTIYSYFADSRALYRAVRERDMEDAVLVFENLAATEPEPRARVRALFLGTVRHWLGHPEHFDVLYAMPTGVHERAPTEEQFGQSAVVVRAVGVYYDAVAALFDVLPSHPLPARLAADAMLAAVYGLIAFPRMTSTMAWSDTTAMAEVVIDAMLAGWGAPAVRESGTGAGGAAPKIAKMQKDL